MEPGRVLLKLNKRSIALWWVTSITAGWVGGASAEQGKGARDNSYYSRRKAREGVWEVMSDHAFVIQL